MLLVCSPVASATNQEGLSCFVYFDAKTWVLAGKFIASEAEPYLATNYVRGIGCWPSESEAWAAMAARC